MTNDKFEEAVKAEASYCLDLLTIKGKEYGPEGIDRLINFKLAAGLQGGTPAQALWGMLTKHLASLSVMINAPVGSSIDKWVEKITEFIPRNDHVECINYLLILYAMIKEIYDEQNRSEDPEPGLDS